ncbi:MAG: hypothetical protein QW176_00950 [Candidatus Bathyarchaeia archaeon]
MKSSRDRDLSLLGIVGSTVLIHAILILWYIHVGLSDYASRGDGLEYMKASEALTKGQLIGAHFPLYPALIAVFTPILGMELAALTVPALFHILFTLTIYRTLRDLGFSDPLPYALLIAFAPPSTLIYSSSALSDGIALFFTALAFHYASKNREGLMLLSSALASSTHYMPILLVAPLAYWYQRNKRRRLPLALTPLIPLAALSLIQYSATGNPLHYVSIHFAYSRRVWGAPLISYPLASLSYMAANLGGANRIFWLTYILLAYTAYGLGLAHAVRARRGLSIVHIAPFYAFTLIYTGYYFIPRFLSYAFPSLMEYAEMGMRVKPVKWLVITAALASIAYALWFLMVRVPSTGFTR